MRVPVEVRDAGGHETPGHAGELGRDHHLRDIAITVLRRQWRPERPAGSQAGLDQGHVRPQQQQRRIARRVPAAGHRVHTADMIMDTPHLRRGPHGLGPLTKR